jgi:hypothetical protein
MLCDTDKMVTTGYTMNSLVIYNATVRSWGGESYILCLALCRKDYTSCTSGSHFPDTFLRWLPPFVIQIAVIINREKNFPFYTLLGSGCVLISYS